MPADNAGTPGSSSNSSASRSASPASDEDGPGAVFTCPYCKSKIAASESAAHTSACRIQATNLGGAAPSNKRRLSDYSTDSKEANIKKKAKHNAPKSSNDKNPKGSSTSPKRVMGKHKAGPVDLNVQCGAIMPDGSQCARSLTCKTHAMSIKRGVVGRTANFDVLLDEWQRRHNPNYVLKKMAKNGGAMPAGGNSPAQTPTASTSMLPVPDGQGLERSASNNSNQQTASPKKSRRNRDGKKTELSMGFGDVSDSEPGSDEVNDPNIDDFDSEDEMEQVLAQVKAAKERARPFPGLTPYTSAFVVRDVKLSRWRDKLATAIAKKSTA